MELSNATRTATLTPNHKEDSDLLRVRQRDSHSTGSLHVPQHPIVGLQRAFGNRAVQQMLTPLILQPKLTIDAHGSDDGRSNPSNLAREAANQSFRQRNMLQRIPLHTLQQNLGNRALARFFQQTPPVAFVGSIQRDTARTPDSRDPDTCGVKTVEIPSPGTPSNGVVLKRGEKASEGILWVKNVGECEIFIHCFDANGGLLDKTKPLDLPPGASEPRFIPPPKTAQITAYGLNDCNKHSVLQYDPCAGIN